MPPDSVAASVSCFLGMKRQEMIKTLRGLGIPLKIIVVTEQVDAVENAGPMRGDQEDFHVLPAGEMEEGVAGL